MKALIFLLAALLFCGFLLYGCDRAMIADEARDEREKVEWLQFSMQHHCKIARDKFFDAQPTWQCDGFEVRHQ